MSSFFWLFLFLSSTLLFYSSLLSFSSLHIVGSLTSKLPLIILTNHWKTTMFRDFPNISRACIFFLLALSLSLFYSSLLCFSSLQIVRGLTSKLPLTIFTNHWKTTTFRGFPNIWRTMAHLYLLSSGPFSFSLLLFFSTLLFCTFHLSILSDV